MAGVWAESIGSGVNVSENDSGSAVAERVGEWDGGMDPLHLEPEVAEEGRGDTEGMDRRADVMGEPGKRQFLGPGPTTDLV